MKRFLLTFLVSIVLCSAAKGRYLIEGHIQEPDLRYHAYLNVVDHWDGFELLDESLILQGCPIDSNGNFRFEGEELPRELGYYRIHFAIPEKTVAFMSSYLKTKNYHTFLLSNTDSVQLELKVPMFSWGTFEQQSNLPENAQLFEMIYRNDKFRADALAAQTEGQEKMVLESQRAYYRTQISDRAHGLLKLYALSQGAFDFEQESALYEQVLEQLADQDFRPVYFTSLEQFIGSKLYRGLKEEVGQLRWWLALTVGIAVVLLLGMGGWIWKSHRQKPAPPKSERQDYTQGLTAKEREVFQLIGEGLTNKQISAQLFISESTVKSHVNSIYRKTGFKSRQEVREQVKRT